MWISEGLHTDVHEKMCNYKLKYFRTAQTCYLVNFFFRITSLIESFYLQDSRWVLKKLPTTKDC